MTRERRLGRGLAALLGTPLSETTDEDDSAPLDSTRHDASDSQESSGSAAASPVLSSDELATSDGGIKTLNVYEIDDNPFQPRRDFRASEIASLAESLKEHDMLQPVLVRRVGQRFQLISGERRLRAAIQAGWSTVPARLREADDRLVAELAIVENLQRKDLNPIEKAMSFKRYLDQHQCAQEDLANRLKINRSTIANLMRLLELPEQVQTAIGRGAISAGHARALLPLGDEKQQISFCEQIRREGLSVRDVERQVQQILQEEDATALSVVPSAGGKKRRTHSQHVASLEQELRVSLGTKVDIRQGSRGRGKVVIHFNSHEEFDRILSDLCNNGRDVEAKGQAG